MRKIDELPESIDGISPKVLTDNLRQLESDGIIYRKDYKTNPPKVEYGMTSLGKNLNKMLDVMTDFGNFYKTQIK